MSVPQVPPRPARSQQQQHPTMAASDIPQIPPRPGQRRSSERSQSPHRDAFARSPFHEPPLGMSIGNKSGGMHTPSAPVSNLDLPQRPPSVSLPSIGQEGNEYADIGYKDESAVAEPEGSGNEPQETRNIGSDLPLHAPRPSFSNSTAKARVSTVTRTDSTQAAAAGIGKAPPSIDDKDPQDRVLKPRVSFRTASSASTERPGSAQTEDDRGIPEIGQRVPMYPDAGDVQAPSPSPFQQQFPAGVGFHNSGIQKPSRNHRRTPSGKEILPPGSYGMHGHGVPSTDHFEKSWYEKHPEALEREEHGQYGPGIGGDRGQWALSSDDLNKLVRETSRSGPNTPGLPNEQIGYIASEEYASRLNTPSSATFYRPLHSNHSQPHVESPLRKQSFPADSETSHGLEKKDSHASHRLSSEHALESETEDDELYVHLPTVRKSKIAGNGYNPHTRDFGPLGGNTEVVGGFIEERGYGVPILASDEVAKTPEVEHMQPAISPAQERRGSNYYSGADSEYQSGFKIGSRSGSASNSRPTSRPGSIHSLPGLSRFSTHDEDRENMHTPLEDVDEYEPLFPDEEGQKRLVTAAERLKLREQMKRFPSKDIWEDTPTSLQLQATVDTPEPSNEQSDPTDKAPAAVFETPEQESARKGEVTEGEKAKLIPKEERLAKSTFKPHLRQEMHRPGLAPRFPSKDIWEDSPDSARLETTVGDSQVNDPKSPPDEGLEAGAVVQTSGAPKEGIIAGEQARDGATAGAKPSIPPRPNKSKVSPPSADLGQAPPAVPSRPPRRLHQVPPADAQVPIAPSKLSATPPVEAKQPLSSETRKGPVLPERSKPQASVRQANPAGNDSPESTPLSKVTSTSSVGSDGASTKDLTSPPPAPKPKPAIPARPAGGKIASLKAGFLSDLDSRLKLGPQGPKSQEKAEPEAEEEKAPLADARKGRAKGPARRKPVVPTTTESAAADDQKDKSPARNWQMQKPWTVWEHDGALKVGRQPSSMPETESILPDDASSAGHSAVLGGQTDGTDDAKAMHQAKLAVEESLTANEPLTQKEAEAPDASLTPGVSELLAPTAEKLNPLSTGTMPELSSPSAALPPTEVHTQNQTEEKTTTVNPTDLMDETMTSTSLDETKGIAKNFSTTPWRRLADVDDSFDPLQQDRESDEVDVCIVGGGPAGLSAAIRLKQIANEAGNEEFRVLLLEKAGELGAHIVSGNVIEPSAVNELLPDWNSPDNPSRFENATPATHDKMRFLTKNSSIPIPAPPQMNNKGNYIISLNQFCKWLGERAEEVGVEVYPGFAASEVLYNPTDGSVKGVATNDLGISRSGKPKTSFERGMEFHARVTLFAEGCHGSLTKQVIKKFDLRRDSQPQTYGLGLKEVWEVKPEKFKKGEIVHTMGYPLPSSTYGGGWLYHFGDNVVSLGLVVGLDYPNPWLSPYGEFQKLKHHPIYKSVIEGGKCLSYGARALNEGGFQSIPKCAFPGGALIGDTAGFLNVPKIKGTHTAMRSGMLAAQAAYSALTSNPDSGTVFLYDYEDALRSSTIWSELKQVRNMRPSFHSPLGLYGGIMYSGLEAYLFRGKTPWTLKHKEPGDYAATKLASECPRIEYPKPDGQISFDILTSVSRTGTNHEEDQPVHLQVDNWDDHKNDQWPKYKGIENRFCPAGVYEYVEDGAKEHGVKFQINAQNCIHCKTCDIKAPAQDITWQTPQGGEGPKYFMT